MTADPLSLCARMSSVERAGPWEVPRELELRATWGNLELDFREATFESGTTTIDVRVTMGNIELIVPPSIEVRLEATTFAASVEQTAASSYIAPPLVSAMPGEVIVPPLIDKRVLRITGHVRFGNLEVIRLWPGETREDAHKHKHRRDWQHEAVRGRIAATLEGLDDKLGPSRHPNWHDRLHAKMAAREAEREAAIAAEIDSATWTRDSRQRLRAERKRAKHRRWRQLHEERDLWRRMRDRGGPWRPWWLMARMRKRIFIWLALAFGGGIAIGWRLTETPAWWWIAIAIIVLSMVSGAIAFRLTRPLILIIKAARDIGDGKLDKLDLDHHGGETRVLASAINDMVEKIEQQMADQRQLLAAVSHELRTPLGHMRVLVETAREPTASVKALGEIEREILTLDDLVGKLLAQSRLEFGNLDRRPMDLGELVGEQVIAAGVAPEAIEASDNVKAPVDPTLIRRAIANLLDNARVHGKGAVAVRVERRAGQVAIEVDDAGPGVAPDKREEAFRAFSPSSGGGLGLGLALVSRIAVAHGGGAWIAERPGGGARIGFTVQA